MSIVCLSHVMRYSEAQLGARLVLFVLAEHAHDDGSNAFPTVETMVERTRMSRRGVQAGLRRLEADDMIIARGFGPAGQVNYQVVMGGEESAPPARGGEADDLGGRTSRRQGGEAAAPNPSFNPSGEPSTQEKRARELAEVWEHYQAARRAAKPRSMGFALGPADRRLIINALKVRDVETCKAAIEGLFRSDFHMQRGYIGLAYALRGGGRSPDPGTTIDRLAHGNGNGNGRGGLLASKTYRGRSWDELTAREQENAKDAASMDLEVWDGGKDAWQDRPAHLAAGAALVAANGNGHVGGYTAENILDD